MRFVNQFFGRGKKVAGGCPVLQGLEPEYMAAIDYAIANGIEYPCDQSIQLRDSNRIKFMKQEGIWDKLDLLYFFDQEQGKAGFARLNFINPNSYYLNPGPDGPPALIDKQGFDVTGMGGVRYFKTGYKPNSNAVNVAVNSCSIFWQGFNIPESSNFINGICGSRSGNNNEQLLLSQTDGNFLNRNFRTGNQFAYANTNQREHHLSTRNGALTNLMRNGVAVHTSSAAVSPAMSDLDMFVMAINDNGNVLQNSRHGLKYFGMGAAINDKALELYQIMTDQY